MSAPLYGYGLIGEGTGLLVALVLGLFFGFFLERAGLGDPERLTGVFYLRDFTVPKVMFTAIIVAVTGLYLLSDLKMLDLSLVWIVPTYFWPQLIGGLIFGIGFFVSGYCPGTAVAGFASGRLDALVTLAGVCAGSVIFAAAFPLIEGFYLSSPRGGITLPRIIGVNHWAIILPLFLFAVLMFFLMERFGKAK